MADPSLEHVVWQPRGRARVPVPLHAVSSSVREDAEGSDEPLAHQAALAMESREHLIDVMRTCGAASGSEAGQRLPAVAAAKRAARSPERGPIPHAVAPDFVRWRSPCWSQG